MSWQRSASLEKDLELSERNRELAEKELALVRKQLLDAADERDASRAELKKVEEEREVCRGFNGKYFRQNLFKNLLAAWKLPSL